MLFDPARHAPLAGPEWSEARARDGIAAIARDAEAAFDPVRLWPLHPADDGDDLHHDRPMRGLYLGAAGMLHGLRRLGVDVGAPSLPVTEDQLDAGASLLVGTSGVLLVNGDREDLRRAVAANAEHPSNEVLLGAPGTMLAAHAAGLDEEWERSARLLLSRQDADGMWTQDLYGKRQR